VFPCGQEANPTVSRSEQMSKRTMDIRDVEEAEARTQAIEKERKERKERKDKIRICRFIYQITKEPGTLVVVIARNAGILMTMFTHSLTTIMSPTDSAVDSAYESLYGIEEFHGLSFREQMKNVQLKACAIDQFDRRLAGSTITQAILSCAAGLNSIKESDDEELKDPDTIKRLECTSEGGRNKVLTNTVHAAMGFAAGIHEEVLQAFTLDPVTFENDFVHILDKELPALHVMESLNKIVICDMKDDTTTNYTVDTHYTTFETKMPNLPKPF